MNRLNRRVFLGQCVTAGTLVSGGLPVRADDNWNQWRGPWRTGRIDGGKEWPRGFESLEKIWSVPLGPSYSGPVWEGAHVYVTEWVDETTERVLALDLSSGKVAWKVEWPGKLTVPFFAASNGSWIRSTPAIADDRLLVGGMRDLLVCLQRSSGEILWKNDLMETQKAPLPAFGFVCSPLVDGPFAYAQAGGGIVKVSLETGEVAWRGLADGGGMNGSAFSSPIIATLQGVRQLVVMSRTHLAGLQLDDGTTLWTVEVPAFRGMNILTPTIAGNAVFTSSYGGGSFCYDIERNGEGKWKVQERWQNRVQGYMSSPILHENHVYLHLRNQRFTCLSLEDGSQTWSSKPFGKYCSLIARGSLILGLDEQGELLLMEANPDEFRLLDRKEVADDTWAHLAIREDQLLVRGIDAITCFRWG